jgi:AraC-like DNA-binding protein
MISEVESMESSDQNLNISSGAAPGWAARLRALLARRLPSEDVSLASVSRQLAVSPRTLQRRLKAEGTSLREQVDAVRRRQATRLLAEGKTKLSVAVRLGYSDDRTLRRAMRRWENQGQPPDSTGPTGTAPHAPPVEPPGAFGTHPDAFRPSPTDRSDP